MSVPPDDDAQPVFSPPGRQLENVEDEVGSTIVRAWGRVFVAPMAVVNRNPHFGRIAVVQTVGAAVILVTPKVLWVVDVRVVVEPLPVCGVVGIGPRAAVSLLCVGVAGRVQSQEKRGRSHRERDPADHRIPPESLTFCAGSPAWVGVPVSVVASTHVRIRIEGKSDTTVTTGRR